MIDHPIDIFSHRVSLSTEDHGEMYPNIRAMMAELPGFKVETADHVYK